MRGSTSLQETKLHNSLSLFSLFVILVVNFILIVSVHWQWNHSMNKYVPLQTEILTSQNDISSDINQKFSNDIIDRKHYFSWILTLFLLMNFAVLTMFFLSKRRQQKYQNAL